MTRVLPARAHLGQLKHQAKDALRAHEKKDAGVCGLLRHLRRFEGVPDASILSAELALSEVQYALAREYGASSWDALKQQVSRVTGVPALTREGDAVFVRDLESLAWGGPNAKQNSVVAAIEAALGTRGERPDYDWLMATSGAAFRLQHKWCPSSPHAKCGFDCATLGASAAGYRLEWLTAKDIRIGNWRYTEEIATAHARAVDSIDRGQPVLWGSEECGLLVGYAESGEWLLRPYAAEKPGYQRIGDWPWYFGMLEPTGKPLTGIECLVHVLSTAVTLAHTPSFGAYTSGFDAYEQWAEELEADALFDDETTFFQVALGNAHTYASLAEARASAARFLTQMAGEAPSGTAQQLARAAQAFAGISALIGDDTTGAPRPFQIFPWCFESRSAWTKEQRRLQASVLRAALLKEREGIAALESALSELGVREPLRT